MTVPEPLPVDRMAPTARPAGRSVGTQRWRSLLFCHWQLPPQQLRPLVPPELEIDSHQGRAYVGLVPFKMREIRPAWLPRRWAFNFYETNVRTYVIHRGRPGVHFFSLDASSRLAVMAARLGWSLPYYHATMSSGETERTLSYRSCRRGNRGNHAIAFRVGRHLGPSEPGTLEHFLFERYLLFVKRRGRIHVGQVHHRPYDVWTAEIDSIDDQLLGEAGFSDLPKPPDLAHYSPGVDVEVFAIRRAN